MSKLTLSLIGVLAMVSAVCFVPSAQALKLDVVAVVDTEVCASGAVQCGGNFSVATSANNNPIRMFVQVVRQTGLPVNNLSLFNFSFSNNLVPAGGGATGICSEAVCGTDRFGGGTNGLYQIFLDRIPKGNWKAGAYAGTVRVNVGADRGTGIVTFTIPEGLMFSGAEELSPANPAGVVEKE